jgi:hypothetical protein
MYRAKSLNIAGDSAKAARWGTPHACAFFLHQVSLPDQASEPLSPLAITVTHSTTVPGLPADSGISRSFTILRLVSCHDSMIGLPDRAVGAYIKFSCPPVT